MRNKIFISTSLCLLLAGCANTTIYPEGDNNFSLVTNSAYQSEAEREALDKATDYCAKMGRRLIVIHHQTNYHGPDKTAAAMTEVASMMLSKDHETTSTRSNDDYEVTMKFTCE